VPAASPPAASDPVRLKRLVALFAAGSDVAAEALARELQSELPSHPLPPMVLGAVLKRAGRIAEALAPQRRAVELLPDRAELHGNLGNTLRALGRPDEAEAAYRRALAIDPRHLDTLFNLGQLLAAAGRRDEAEAAYRAAIAVRPGFAEAHHRLGVLHDDGGQALAAEAFYRKALALDPTLAAAADSLGGVLLQTGRGEEALACCRQAASARPDRPDFVGNLLFTMNYLPADAPDRDAACRRRIAADYGALVAAHAARFAPAAKRQALPSRPGPRRVGLVSGDLRRHSIAGFLLGWIGDLDRRRVELHAFPTSAHHDAVSDALRPHFASWHPIPGLDDAEAADAVRAAGIDLLIDLAGHTGHNRLPLFALRPAPVQATWLGYMATTGVEAIDFLLADRVACRPEDAQNFSERIWLLPATCLCLAPPPAAPSAPRSSADLVFGSFNNLAKLSAPCVAAWARILAALPGSRLILKAQHLGEGAVASATRARFAALGIGGERIELRPMTADTASHLAAYGEVDIALDTFPYPGVTTTLEAIACGVPVLTMAGDGTLLRLQEAIAIQAGLADWIAIDPDDYVARALRHAADRSALATQRAMLAARALASPLFDGRRFAADFADAVEGMCRAGPREATARPARAGNGAAT
jgi:predicted O-linked N-acetylglucosamine transferase (SPINDLY family)